MNIKAPHKIRTVAQEKKCRRGTRLVYRDAAAPSTGIVYMRGIGVDWGGYELSKHAGDEYDQFTNGDLTYAPSGGTRQDLTSFFQLKVNSVLGNKTRFQDVFSGDALKVDHLTGKCWAIDHSAFTGALSWAEALDEVAARNTANYRGRSNWRMCTLKELMMVTNQLGSSTPLDHFGAGVYANTLWTSTVPGKDDTKAFAYDGITGQVSMMDQSGDAAMLMVCTDLV